MPTYLSNFFRSLDLIFAIIAKISKTTKSMINNLVIELIIANNICIDLYNKASKEYEEADKEYGQFDHSVASNAAAAAYCKYEKAFRNKSKAWDNYMRMSDWIFKEFECIYWNKIDPVTVEFKAITYMDKVHTVYLHGYKISNRQRKQLLDQGVKIYK